MKAVTLTALSISLLSLFAEAAPKVPRVTNPRVYGPQALAAARKQAAQSHLLSSSYAAAPQAAFNEKYACSDAATSSAAVILDSRTVPTDPDANIWASLTNDEAAAVIAFLHSDKASLNLTAAENATSWDNAISVVDLLLPNKTEALVYLDKGGPRPERWAKVSIMYGATEEPYVETIAVGPISTDNSTEMAIANLGWQTSKGEHKIRVWNMDEDRFHKYTLNISASMQDVVMDLIGLKAVGDDDDTASTWGTDPVWQQGNATDPKIIRWVGYWANIEGFPFDSQTLLPQGIYFEVETTGRDPSKWKEMGWLYNNVYYEDKAAFRTAWSQPGFEKAAQRNTYGTWTATDRQGEPLAEDAKARPVVIAPEGQRFSVDSARKFIQWGSFSAYMGFSRDTGLRLFDIAYDGQRIIYELGLDEAIASYSGNDPVQAGTSYLDTYYSFGAYAFELAEGYDCPAGAYFFNSTFHAEEQSRTHHNSICAFEMPMDYPIQRHSSGSYISITSNVALIIKSVSSVGNYDYSLSYIFYLDGSIETRVQASGYIQAAFYAHNEDFGYQIHDGLSGSMHDHVLSFRLDPDILGVNNTFAKHSIVPVNQTYPWSRGISRPGMKMVRSVVETEDDGALNWPANGSEMYVIVNQDEPNAYGEPRGFRIMPSLGSGHVVNIQDSPNLLKSQSFATHPLYVLQRKDSEASCASPWNNYDTGNPIIDFSTYFNGESLNQTDLVLQFGLGMLHVPHTGDLPNTVQTTAQASIIFSPHNYLLSDPSRRTNQQIRLDYDSSNARVVSNIERFGASPAPNWKYNLSDAYPTLQNYRGDVTVRKFPYDPLQPFGDT
ncbi:copper amine oxidase [Tilletiaria anomala UBC 951]|uniref:Amine oxidase n=1 Tax=Tilletiaria anomala (strain ATCC 24038 / CBS 436.72 / UBC 951) TaxID=1037660 RepID=A0A066W7R8_TILAU|nr:copper amine oxidase [Tilletiaria anomala UBC 951]KDN47129.1 copper amine oxidase [Tilletiaria anomala UBC 951]